MIRLQAVSKSYWQGGREIPVLSALSLNILSGESVSLMGASGAGKSTLLQLLGCLDRPDSGHYWLDGEEVSQRPEEALAQLRNRKLGFVFQSSHFVEYLDLADNVALPGFYGARRQRAAGRERARALLDQVGLSHRWQHLPAQLSGGERQRAAVARALFNEPRVLLADEPTGNLDEHNTEQLLAILTGLQRRDITLLLVTHDDAVAARAGRRLRLRNGQLEERHALA